MEVREGRRVGEERMEREWREKVEERREEERRERRKWRKDQGVRIISLNKQTKTQ